MVSNIMQGFQGILLIFMLIGLLMGIWRGFNKSLIRLFVVMAMSIICFFITRPISQALINMNIAKLGIKIDGADITTIKEGVVAVVEKVGFISELMTASPTFAAFVDALPIMILNMVVFSVCFLILTLFSILISWLLSKWILHKIPKKERNRHRFLGGIVGAIQGVFVFAVVAVPVVGIMNTADRALFELNQPTAQTATFVSENEDPEYSLMTQIVSEESKPIVDTSEYNKYIADFNKLPFMKVFKALGIKKLEVVVYKNLTTMPVNKEKVCLENEIVTLSKATANIDSLAKLSGSSSAQDFQNARDMVTNLFDSKLFSHITEEVVNYAATEWSDESNPKVFGIEKPNLGDIGNPLLDGALVELKSVTRVTLKNDLIKTIDLMETASKNGLFSALTGNSDSENILKLFAQNDGAAIAEFIDIMVESDTLSAILPEAIQTGLNAMYPTLGVPANETEKADCIADNIKEIADTSFHKATEIKKYMDRWHFDLGTTDEATTQSELEQIEALLLADMEIEDVKQVLLNNTLTYTNEDDSTKQVSLLDTSLWKDLKTKQDLAINKQITKEEWKQEKNIFASIFANIYTTFNSVKNVESGKEFDSMNFDALGCVFDSMRHSFLLDDKTKAVSDRTSFNIVRAILQSNLMSGIDVTSSFMNTIETNWDNEDFKFEEAFSTLGSTIKILDKITAKQDLDAENVKGFIEGLRGESGDVVKDILKDDIFKSSSSSNNLQSAVTDMLDSLSDPSRDTQNADWDKEAAALNSTLDVLQNRNSLDTLDADVAERKLDTLLDSDIVFDSLVDAASAQEGNVNLSNNTEGNGFDQAFDSLEEKYADDADKLEKLNTLRNLFFPN